MIETFREIESHPNYEVSDKGNVRNKKTGKILKANKDGDCYLYVGLCSNGVRKKLYVHRLIAEAFIPNDDSSKTYIDHINEIKSDNRIVNLRWCSSRENTNYHHNDNINRGVILTHSNTYRSQISVNGKYIRKNFKTFEEAVADFKLKYKLYYGTDCTSVYDESKLVTPRKTTDLNPEDLIIEVSTKNSNKWKIRKRDNKNHLKHSQLIYLGFNTDWNYPTAAAFLLHLQEKQTNLKIEVS